MCLVEPDSLFSMGRELKKPYWKRFHNSDWLALSKLYNIKMTNIQTKFIYPNLRKEEELLNVNSVNKFNFNGRIKASVE